MNDRADSQLLRDYAERGSEPAFAELVRRHVDFVYTAALRMVCDSHLAEDVTQSVFLALAKNAAQLTDRPVLSGWLHRTAQNIAAQTVRTDVRRRAREQEAAAMNELLSAESNDVWDRVAPQLDNALGELSEPDRDALLLRFFERKSAHEMAQALGISDEAAQKRVSRAIERLRDFFAKRGIAVGASGLVVVISANAVQAAPVGLAVTISTTAAALAGTTIATTATATATKAMAMTTIQKTLIAVTVTAAVGVGIYEAHQASQLKKQIQALEQQPAPLIGQAEQWRQQRDDVSNQLHLARQEIELLRSNTAELPRLRGEVTRLRESAREMAQLKAASTPATQDPAMDAMLRSWSARVARLRQSVEQMPGKWIPELQLLTDKDWVEAVRDLKQMETDEDIRQALSNLRSNAKRNFGTLLRKALQQYATAHDGWLPADLSQLKPYFETPIDDATLLRYQLARIGRLSEAPQKEPLVVEKAPPVDDEYDTIHLIRMNGTTVSNTDRIGDRVVLALEEFAQANQGLLPRSPSQLTPYLKQPRDAAKVQAILSEIPPEFTTFEQLKNRAR